MGIELNHPQYDALNERAEKLRDFISGEVAVKAKGERYLYKPSCLSDADYCRYQGRAVMPDVVGETANRYIAKLFEQNPKQTLASGLEYLVTEAGLGAHKGLEQFARNIAREVMSGLRYGVLVDYVQGKPQWVGYSAESIVNWKYDRAADGAPYLSLVVLEQQVSDPNSADSYEHSFVTERLELGLDEGRYYQRLWVSVDEGDNKTFTPGDLVFPQMQGRAIDFIPFQFFPDADGNGSVLEALTHLVQRYMETSADIRNVQFFAGQPQPYVSDDGMATDTAYAPQGCSYGAGCYSQSGAECAGCNVGPSGSGANGDTTIGSENLMVLGANAKVGYLEPKGAMQSHMHNELALIAEQIQAHGGRMSQNLTAGNATATAAAISAEYDNTKVRDMARALTQGIAQLLAWSGAWLNISDPGDYQIDVKRVVSEISADDLTKLVAMASAGTLPLNFVINRLVNAGQLPEGYTIEQWVADTESNPSPEFMEFGGSVAEAA